MCVCTSVCELKKTFVQQQCEDKKEVAEEKDVVTSPELKSETAEGEGDFMFSCAFFSATFCHTFCTRVWRVRIKLNK